MPLNSDGFRQLAGNIALPSINFSANFCTGVQSNIGVAVGNVLGVIDQIQSAPEMAMSLASNAWRNISQNALSDIGSATGAIVGSIMGVVASAESIVETIKGLLNKFKTDTIQYIQVKIQYIISELAKIVIQFPIKLAKAYAEKMAKRIAELTKTMISGLVLDNDIINMVNNIKNIQDRISELTDGITGIASELTNKIKVWGDRASETIKIASDWIAKGEDYIIDGYNELWDDLTYECDTWVDEKLNNISMKADQQVDDMSTKWANAVSDETILDLVSGLKKSLDKVNTQLDKVKISAKTKIRGAIMSLLAQIGV